MDLFKQGAEARLYSSEFYGKKCMIKERFPKLYRQPQLDKSLTAQRIKSEVRAILRCRNIGIPVPTIYMVNLETGSIYLEFIEDSITLREHIQHVQKECAESAVEVLKPLASLLGRFLAKMHKNGVLHGDLTTSNILLKGDPKDMSLVFIDFGLSYTTRLAEDKGVDLYVLERALLSTHPNTEMLFDFILEGYRREYKHAARDVLAKLDEIRLRGRKRTMVG